MSTDMGTAAPKTLAHLDYLGIHAVEFARQLTLFHALQLRKVTLAELCSAKWETDLRDEFCPNVSACLEHSRRFQVYFFIDKNFPIAKLFFIGGS